MTQQLLPMPLPPATEDGLCGKTAVVIWFHADGGTVTACEPHRNDMTPEGRFHGFALLRPGVAKCGWRET